MRWAEEVRKEIAAFTIAGLLCAVFLTFTLQLWRADLRVPFYYTESSDVLVECMIAKNVIEDGWYGHNPRLGAPGTQNLADFPVTDQPHWLAMKAISWIVPRYGAVLNIYFLLGFFLATWIAMAVLRHFQVARAPALTGGLLFAFVPYHFYRNEIHLTVSCYFLIPLIVMVLLWVVWGEPLFLVKSSDSARTRLAARKGVLALLIVFLSGFSTYYGFFAAFLMLFAGLCGLFEGRSLERLKSLVALGGALALGAVASIAPSLLYMRTEGRNPITAVRGPGEAEFYALQLIELLLPRNPHRIPYLGHFRAAYSRAGLLVNENIGGALGMIGTLGFCFLLVALFTGFPSIKHGRLLRGLSLLNLAALLIGTMGGIGAVFAYLISPEIRAYNRISIYIAFFSISAMVFLLDWLWQRRFRGMVILLPLVLAGGILEQTAPSDVPPYVAAKTVFERDDAFVSRIESTLPVHEMVLQLPYLSFPEHGPLNGMSSYDPVRAYLHSRTLRWSFGAMAGRYADAPVRDLSTQAPPEMVRSAALMNFGGIYIDRAGYKDSGAALEQDLRDLLKENPLESSDHRFAFYNLIPFRTAYRAGYSTSELQRIQDGLVHPLVARWGGAFSALESTPQQNWRWCGAHGELILENGSTAPADVELSLWLSGAGPQTVLRISGIGFSDAVPLDGSSHTVIRRNIEVPPGRHTITFTSAAPEIHLNGDSRPLSFAVHDFHATAAGIRDRPAEPHVIVVN